MSGTPVLWYHLIMTTSTAEHESSIFERLVVSPQSAAGILDLKFTPQDEDRMRELMDKNNKGTLTPEEQTELEAFRRVGSLLGILQARARLHLKRQTESNTGEQ